MMISNYAVSNQSSFPLATVYLLLPTLFTYLCPEKECVQKPPSMSHTRAVLSALPVAKRPPDESTIIWAIGDLWPCIYYVCVCVLNNRWYG